MNNEIIQNIDNIIANLETLKNTISNAKPIERDNKPVSSEQEYDAKPIERKSRFTVKPVTPEQEAIEETEFKEFTKKQLIDKPPEKKGRFTFKYVKSESGGKSKRKTRSKK